MSEVVNATAVLTEPLDAFLRAEEKAIAELLASQERCARANLEPYAPRPETLAFVANAERADDARRLAFLMALRVSPNTGFALFVQPDPRAPLAANNLLAFDTVNFLPEQPNSTYRFVGLKAGEKVPPLAVLTSASDEPDYGLDINLSEDSPSDWGKVYGHASLAPGDSTFDLISANVLAMAGWPKRRDELIILLCNWHLALEKYQNQSLLNAARAKLETPLDLALRSAEHDRGQRTEDRG